ncbi:MAG: hypothetical protein HDKAJFGB_00916 [Anaerolineae bacterium]|nr:hypothetical protein [Anaerolineae bacterium]
MPEANKGGLDKINSLPDAYFNEISCVVQIADAQIINV